MNRPSRRGKKDKSPEQSVLKAIIKIAKDESVDPYGRVNIGFGVVLFGILVLAVLRYFAGSIAGEVKIPGLNVKLEASSSKDLVAMLFMLIVAPVYWLVCMRAFVQLDPFRGPKGGEIDG